MTDMVFVTAIGNRDENRCISCGGGCCKLYHRGWHDGAFLRKVDRWYRKLDEYVSEFGQFTPFAEMWADELPTPLFDPIRAWGAGDEAYRRELVEARVNPVFCEYHNEDGCIIPWNDRPAICRNYRCGRWIADEKAKEARGT